MTRAGVTARQTVRPRDAASLVLLRQGPQGPEVLMGRRAGGHRFLPHVYAFPGGRLDSSDRSQIPLNNLKYNDNFIEYHFACKPPVATALAVAALRETWEETGIALGRIEGGRLVPDLAGLTYLCRAITPAESPIRFHARFFLRDVTGLPLTLGGSGELLDLAFRPLPAARALPLADITEFVLDLLAGLGPDPTPARHAFWRYRLGNPLIRWTNP
jgi:8-oxo-dGTP pyrophosphatase MutT (NUDIX family)